MKTHTINCRELSTTLFVKDIAAVDYLTVTHVEVPGYGSVRLRKPLYVITVWLKDNNAHKFIYDKEADWHHYRTQLEGAINRDY